MTFLEKLKLAFTANSAYEKFLAGPTSSFTSGSFWAKVCAAAVAIWYGAQGFVPHPYDLYITTGLAVWASLESYYLKKNHTDALVDLSKAPVFDPNQFAQTMTALVTKFPALTPAAAPVTAAVTEVVKEASSVTTVIPVPPAQ